MLDFKRILKSTQLLLNFALGRTNNVESDRGFDREFYLSAYPDVARAKVNPFRHFLNHGRAEGRIGKLEFHGELGGQKTDQTKRTILVAVHELSMTGAPILGYNLVTGLHQDFNIVGLSLKSGPLKPDFAKYCVHVYVPRTYDDRDGASLSLEQIIDEQRVCAAVLNSVETEPVTHAAKKVNLPIVGLIHEFLSYVPVEKMQRFANSAQYLVFSSKLTKQAAAKRIIFPVADRVLILPQGQCKFPDVVRLGDASILRSLLSDAKKSGKFVCIGCGTVHDRKGVDLFVDAAAAVMRMGGNLKFQFIWIGDGYEPSKLRSYSRKLQTKIRKSKLGDDFRLIESVNSGDLADAYNKADCFFLSSRLDPLPNVCIDALSAGLPVICFRHTTGIAEYLDDTKEGRELVVEQVDTNLAAQAIFNLSADARRLASTRKSMKRIARSFNMERYIESISKLLERCI